MLKLHVQTFGYSVIGHGVIILTLTKTYYYHILLLIKLDSLGLDLITDHLYIIAMGYQECLYDENFVVYDLVDLVNSVDGILVAECLKRIISNTLNFIIRNKVDRFKVRGFFLYFPTNWYHPTFGVCMYVRQTEGRTCK